MEKSTAVVRAGHCGQNLVRNFHELGALRAVCDSKEEVVTRYARELPEVACLRSFELNLGRFRREQNILWSFAPDDISVMMHPLNERPSPVVAKEGAFLQLAVADVTVSHLDFASGVQGHRHIFVSWLHPFKEHKLVVVGTRAMPVFSDTGRDKHVLFRHQIDWIDWTPVPVKAEGEPAPIEATMPLRAECAHFLECLETRPRPLPDGTEGLAILEVLEACQRSLNQAGPVTIGQDRRQSKPRFFVRPTSFGDDGCRIGDDTHIRHFCHIMRGARIGRKCVLGQNVFVGADVSIGDGVKIHNHVSVYKGVTLEDHVFCGPSVVFMNVVNPRSEIDRTEEFRPSRARNKGVSLGANATIVCGHTIGRYAMVGAGAVATRDVLDLGLVVGAPARQVGWVCRCGSRLVSPGGLWRCPTCGAAYLVAGQGGIVRTSAVFVLIPNLLIDVLLSLPWDPRDPPVALATTKKAALQRLRPDCSVLGGNCILFTRDPVHRSEGGGSA